MVALTLVMLFALSIFASATATGGTFSDSATKKHNGSYSELKYNVRIVFTNVLNEVRFTGTSSMKWLGSTPYNADSVQLTNTVKISSLGGVSISGSGGGVSTSGSTMSDQMTVSNSWKCESNFTYNASSSLVIFTANLAVSGRTQIGSSFYSLSLAT